MSYLVKTNYFHVKDELRFYYLTSHTCNVNREPIRVMRRIDENGDKTFCITSNTSILGTFVDDFDHIKGSDIYYGLSRFYNRLQECLPDGECFVLIDLVPVNAEQMRDRDAEAHVLTANNHQSISLTECAAMAARKMLQNPRWILELGPL